MVSALPQRSENTHHVSKIENYPATLEVLGEPIRQVGDDLDGRNWWCLCLFLFVVISIAFLLNSGTLPSVGRSSRNQDVLQRSPPPLLPVQELLHHLQTKERQQH